MSWSVHKFGGTSLATAEGYRTAARIVESDPATRKAVVVSAMGGVTDALLELVRLSETQDAANAVRLKELRRRELELVGELGVVVGSLEDGSLWDGQVIRMVEDGVPVRARGMLRRTSRPPASGYRGAARGYALEGFGTHRTLDVACDRRPRRIRAHLVDELGAWAHLLIIRNPSGELVVATPGQMYGRKYTQEMLDASEPVEMMAEAALALVTGDPREVTGGIRYSKEVVEEYGLTPADIGMEAPQPN